MSPLILPYGSASAERLKRNLKMVATTTRCTNGRFVFRRDLTIVPTGKRSKLAFIKTLSRRLAISEPNHRRRFRWRNLGGSAYCGYAIRGAAWLLTSTPSSAATRRERTCTELRTNPSRRRRASAATRGCRARSSSTIRGDHGRRNARSAPAAGAHGDVAVDDRRDARLPLHADGAGRSHAADVQHLHKGRLGHAASRALMAAIFTVGFRAAYVYGTAPAY